VVVVIGIESFLSWENAGIGRKNHKKNARRIMVCFISKQIVFEK
jgi:hypothetical protein